MNLTPAQKVRLGAFLLAGLTILVGSVLVLAGARVWERRDVYIVRFAENVSGLEPSASVKYQGLRVGRVESMRIAPNEPEKIEVTLSLEPGTPLHEGTTAVMDASGLTGLKTINLTGGDPRKSILKPGAELPPGESFLDRITGKAEQVAVKAEVIANQLARWTSDDNRMRVERILDAIERLANNVDKTVVDTREPFKQTLESVAKMSKHAAELEVEGVRALAALRDEIEKTGAATRSVLNNVDGRVKAVDGKELNETIIAARRAMASLDKRLSAEETGQAITDLRATLQNTTRLLADLDLVMRSSKEDFTASMSYIRQAAEDLREFSRIIAQDPSVLLRGQEISE